MPLLLVVREITFIDSSIAIDEFALPVHFIVLKVALVTTATWPHVLSVAFHFIGTEGPLVACLIKHSKFTVTVPKSVLVLSLEHAIVPSLTTLAMLLVIEPAAFIDGAIGPDQFPLA